MTHALSIAVFIVLLFGFKFRKRKEWHIPIMLSCFLIDLGLVLYIELTRKAIHTATHGMHPFVAFHVGVSTLTVLAYLFLIFLGVMILRGIKMNPVHPIHRIAGLTFLVLRFTNLATSLWIEKFIR